jgi:hypothetical protein
MFDVLKTISYDIPSMIGIIIAIGFFLRHLKFMAENSKQESQANRDIMLQVAQVLQENSRALGQACEAFHGAEELMRRAQENETHLKNTIEQNTQIINKAIFVMDKAENSIVRIESLIKGEFTNA